MALPLWVPLRALVGAVATDAAGRAARVAVTVALASVAVGFAVAAGVVALSNAVGFPVAALIVSAVFAFLALTVHLVGRSRERRRTAERAALAARTAADLALVTTLARVARPGLPVAALVAAFLLARRP